MIRSRVVAWLFAAALLGACNDVEPPLDPSAQRTVAQAPRPNILVIVTDDQDLRSLQYMPNVRRLLADRGRTFDNAFVTVAACCPSRASILRGQYVHNHGIWSNDGPSGGYPGFRSRGLESSTIATWLNDAGYRTALVGKYLNDYPPPSDADSHIPPGWDDWFVTIGPQGSAGIYRYFEYRMNDNGVAVSFGSDVDDYKTDVIGERALALLQDYLAGAAPFFLLVTPTAPHVAATPAPRHAGTLPGAIVPRSPSFDEEDVSDKPAWIRSRLRLSASEISELDALSRRRAESLLAVDEMVGRLISAVEAANALDRTYIFFTSDNGYHLGEHRLRHGKGRGYEEDIRVPMIVAGPGIVAGSRSSKLVLNIDLAPTWAELANVGAPATVDGRSLVPILRGNALRWRHGFLVEQHGPGVVTGALRTQNLFFAEYPGTGEHEFYDLRADPLQLNSGPVPIRIGREHLRAWTRILRRCAGESCRAAEERIPLW